MSDNIDVNISEEIVQEVVEIHVDENAAQAAIDAAALAQNILEDIQEIAANISEINTIITDSGFTKVAEIFTAAANSIWNINGLEYTNPADVIINIPLAASGMQRWDRIVLDTNNLFVRVPGPEIEVNAPVPTLPDDTLEYTLFLVTDSAVGDATPPLVGNQYVKKSFYSPYIFSGTGSDAIIPLHPDGYSEIRLTNSGLVSIAGYDLSLITGVPSAEVPQNGKPYIIRNLTGHSIIIKHQLPAADFPFWLNDTADLEFPNNTAIYCHYDISGFNEIFKGWGGISYPLNDNYIYGVKNNIKKRIDTLLTDSLMFAHTCQTGTTLYGTIVTAGNSAFSLGTHANYGSFLNAIAASKVTSAATLGSVACYRNSFSHINSTSGAKFKTETFITITNTVAPISSRLSTGFVNYSWSGGSNVNPSAHALLSFCNDDGEDYLKFCHRKIDGTVGVVSMGNLFPAKFINQAHVYQCCFYFLGNHHGFATIKDLVTGNYFESAIVEVYKSFESNGLTFVNHINNNTTAEAVGFAQSGQVTKYIYGL